MRSMVITEMERRKMSKQCKKCLRGAMTVHIAANGHAQKKQRMDYYEKAQKYVNKKWKEKYGDDHIDNVKMYK